MEYREKVNVSELVEEYIKQCEQEYDPSSSERNGKSEKAYSESLEKMKHIDLQDFTKENTEQIIQIVQRYLYDWGSMGRVLRSKRFQNWQSRLTEEIWLNRELLKDFSSKDLIAVKLSECAKDIQSCYESLSGPAKHKVVGHIAATKVLHLICPNFFPMWDNAIADGVRNQLKKRGDKETRIKAFSKEDYYRFVCVIQDFAKQNEHVLSKFTCEPHKTKLKVLDECLLWAVRRPYYLFSFR